MQTLSQEMPLSPPAHLISLERQRCSLEICGFSGLPCCLSQSRKKCSSFLPHHCLHQLCGEEAWKGIPAPRKEAEDEFPSAEDPLAHVWPASSASSSCPLTWSFPPARGDDKLFQPHGVPKATPVPSAWGCQGCLRQGWGLWGAGDSAPVTPHAAPKVPITPRLHFSAEQGPVAAITHPCGAETMTQRHLSTFFIPHTQSQPAGLLSPRAPAGLGAQGCVCPWLSCSAAAEAGH